MTPLRLMGLDLAGVQFGSLRQVAEIRRRTTAAAAELARWTRIGVRKAEALAVATLLERGLSEDGAGKKTPEQVVS